jgi:hypothetical protein
MLFDTLKRKNKAEQEERAWSQQAPAAYESRNKETMDALTGQVGSGYDGSTLAKAYQQYREQAADAAAKSAENAQATAAALAGGYGSSYADSVARQNQAAALEGIASAVPGLRSKALTEYQNEQNGLLAALSGMGTTEALDRSAYGSNLANYNNQLNFLRSQSAQARNENDNFWNNVWNGIKTAGNVAMTAYDGYKGYTQQQWENKMAQAQFDFQKQQYADSLARQDKEDKARAYEVAFNLQKAGAGGAASDVLNEYGLNADVFANYTGAPITRDDQASALSAAASLVADGNPEAAANLLKMYGMDANAAGTYTTLMQRQLATAAAKAALTKTGSSGRSSGSGGKAGASGGSNHGYTNAQLLQMSKTYSSMKDSDPQKEYYQQVLTDAGYLEPETVSGTGSYKPSYAAVDAVSGAQKANNRSTGAVGKSGQTISRAQVAANAAKGQWKKGADLKTIYNSLRLQGYSEAEIEQALNALE